LHEWTAQLLDFLRELLRLTVGPEADESVPFDTLRKWVEDLLVTKTSVGKFEGTLVDQVVGQVDAIQERLGGLLRGGPSGGVEYELLSFRVSALRGEQNKLAGILSAIAQGGLLGRGHVIKLLKWLKKSDRVDGIAAMVFT
jgi:nuclear pore complex protein Nup205